LTAGLEELHVADGPVADAQRNEQGAPPAPSLHVAPLGIAQARVVGSCYCHRLAAPHDRLGDIPLGEREAATDPAVAPGTVGGARDAADRRLVLAQKDVAARHVDHLTQLRRRGGQYALHIQAGGKIDARLVDQRQALGARTEVTVLPRVGDRLGGDLS